jgi:hypothetical protein
LRNLRFIFSVVFSFVASGVVSQDKQLGSSAVINVSPCVNEGFESTSVGIYTAGNAVTGWSITSQTASCSLAGWTSGSPEFSIISTPLMDPIIGILPVSPFGGTVVAKLHDSNAGALVTKLTTSFPVTSSNPVFNFAYAGAWQQGAHNCCEQAGMKVIVRNCTGSVVSCYSFALAPTYSVCVGGVPNYSWTGNTAWTGWTTKQIDLSFMIGSCVSVEIINNDCSIGDHWGSVYFDSNCLTALIGQGLTAYPVSPVGYLVPYCPASNVAMICGPLGALSYSWIPPFSTFISPSQSTMSCLTIINPFANTAFTLQTTTPGGCVISQIYVLTVGTASIVSIGATPSCSLGASGSATVLSLGSGNGYSITWTNSLSAVVGTGSIATNLPPGNYTVSLSVNGFPICGISTASVNVLGNAVQTYTVGKPFCGANAYLVTKGGSNFQWYNGTAVIPGNQGGNSPTLTVFNATTGSTYWLSYMTYQGCRDSVQYLLGSTSPGSSTTFTTLTCPNQNIGTATISINPSSGSQVGLNSFYVSSTGTTTPFSASLFPTSATIFTLGLLPAGIFSTTSFDGACYYSTSFTVNPLLFSFSVTSGASTLCPGYNTVCSVIMTTQPNGTAFSYSWTPNLYFSGNVNTQSQVFISNPPTLPASTVITYSVKVTPNSLPCPQSQTLTLNIVKALQPTINAIPSFCNQDPPFIVTATPAGGIFSGPGLAPNGVLSPTGTPSGTLSFTYWLNTSGCNIASTTTALAFSAPLLSVSGNTHLCLGDSTTLYLYGPSTFSWNGSASQPSVLLTPTITTTHTLSAINSTNGCYGNLLVTVSVTPIPQLNITGTFSLCAGQNATLTASGAQSYTWSPAGNGPVVVFNPTVINTATVTGANDGKCAGTQTITIYVHPKPVITISGNLDICKGDSTAITAGGASNYLWSPSGATAPIVLLGPLMNSTYNVVGTSSANCTSSRTFSVAVSDCVGLQNQNLGGEPRIFPNPTNGILKLVLTDKFKLEIFDVSGKKLISIEIKKGDNDLDLESLNPGMYIISISNNDFHKSFYINKY